MEHKPENYIVEGSFNLKKNQHLIDTDYKFFYEEGIWMQPDNSFYYYIMEFVQEMFQNVFKDKLAFDQNEKLRKVYINN